MDGWMDGWIFNLESDLPLSLSPPPCAHLSASVFIRARSVALLSFAVAVAVATAAADFFTSLRRIRSSSSFLPSLPPPFSRRRRRRRRRRRLRLSCRLQEVSVRFVCVRIVRRHEMEYVHYFLPFAVKRHPRITILHSSRSDGLE